MPINSNIIFGRRQNAEGRYDGNGSWVTFDRNNPQHQEFGRCVVQMADADSVDEKNAKYARLFVASEDMYEALQDCVKLLPSAHPVVTKARAALNRAENEPIPGEQ